MSLNHRQQGNAFVPPPRLCGTLLCVLLALATPSASAVLPSVTAIPPPACTQGSNPDTSCFTALDLTDYVTEWWSDNEDACGTYDGFADCWYGLETPYAPSTCSQLNANPACEQPKWADFPSSDPESPSKFYVSWSIFNTNAFFLGIYSALGLAEGNVNGLIGGLVQEFDPPLPPDDKWTDVLLALTFGLRVYSEGSIVLKALIRSGPQTTGLAEKLIPTPPTGTAAQHIATWDDAQTAVTNFVRDWETSIGDGLPLLANNATAFAAWADSSGISGEQPPSDGLTTTIGQALGAGAIGYILNALDVVVSRAADTDVHDLQNNGTAIVFDPGCADGYDDAGVCSTFFYDGTDTYGLTNPSDWTQNYNAQLEYIIGGENPITTGELLFSGGHQCAVSCGTNGGCAPSTDPSDPSSAQCISNLRTCTWEQNDLTGPFSVCDNIGDPNPVLVNWGINQCSNGPANERS